MLLAIVKPTTAAATATATARCISWLPGLHCCLQITIFIAAVTAIGS